MPPAATLNALIHCARLGIEPTPLHRPELLSQIFFFSFFRAALEGYGNSHARVESVPQLLAYTAATATRDSSRI